MSSIKYPGTPLSSASVASQSAELKTFLSSRVMITQYSYHPQTSGQRFLRNGYDHLNCIHSGASLPEAKLAVDMSSLQYRFEFSIYYLLQQLTYGINHTKCTVTCCIWRTVALRDENQPLSLPYPWKFTRMHVSNTFLNTSTLFSIATLSATFGIPSIPGAFLSFIALQTASNFFGN